MKNKIRLNALYATVAASTIMLTLASNKEATAQVTINYTGTQTEYDALQTDPIYSWGKSVRPPSSGIQSGNIINISDQGGLGDDFVAPYNVFGGFDDTLGTTITVNNNTVVITGGIISGAVFGGSGNGEAAITVGGNRVEISAGEIGSDVYGGSGSGYISSDSILTVSGNNVDISGGTIAGSVYGGAATEYSYDTDSSVIVNDNKVVISGNSVVNGYVVGGTGYGGGNNLEVKNNSVVITDDSTVNYTIIGGEGYNYNSENSTNVSGNSVSISGNATTGDIIGGDGYGAGTNTVSDNHITISGNAKTGTLIGGLGYGEDFVTVSGNRVEVSSGEIDGYIFGGSGSLYISSDATLMVSGNNVDITGGTVAGNVYGGVGEVYSGSGSAFISSDSVLMVSGNRVDISGGTIEGDIYGGYADVNLYDTDVVDNGAIAVSENRIAISGGTVEGDVYGGAAYGYIYNSEDGSILDEGIMPIATTKNIITLENGAVINGSIYGGYVSVNDVEVTDWNTVVAGNTLNLNSYSGSVLGVYNFENYNWILPKSAVNNGSILQITGEDAVNLENTKHTIAVVNDGTRLKVDDTIVMITKADGTPASVPDKVPDEIQQGHFIIYDVDVKVDDEGKFILKVLGVEDEDAGRINPGAEAFLEGRAAALGFVSQGSDLIATAGIDNIRTMVRSKDEEFNRIPLIPFAIMKGDSNRYKTGSHADIDGFHMATGLAGGGELNEGNKITFGAFFEYGRGTYDTYNSFTNYGSVHGDGGVHYTGGGVFGRMDFVGTGLGRVANLAPTQADGVYLEASLRAGRVSMSFDSDDLIDPEGYRGNYNSKAGYIGGHAAVGYAFNFDEQQALDTYGRYLWTRMNGDSVSIGKDTLHFDKSTSSRMQLGGRYSYAYSDQFKPYLGTAYEYEFKGDIGATAYDLRVDKPSLKGSTGIIEAGFTFTPDPKIPSLSLNLNAQGFFGQRQGGAGEIKIKYQF